MPPLLNLLDPTTVSAGVVQPGFQEGNTLKISQVPSYGLVFDEPLQATDDRSSIKD
jgi:hypothetical protein